MGVKTQVLPFRMPDDVKVFSFEVILLDGPLTKSYLDSNPEPPSRIIAIQGKQTLRQLHESIFTAFDRYDPHLYEFQIGGKRPMDRKAIRYSEDNEFDEPKVFDARTTPIADLKLQPGQKFLYWFDFGDDWWHGIELLSIEDAKSGKGRYPRIVEKKGESPPQYANWDEEDDDYGDEYERRELSPEEQKALTRIFAPIEAVCRTKLTGSYADVCSRLLTDCLLAGLALHRSKPQSWAAGALHAVGMVNFLGDPASTPHMKLRDIAREMGVSVGTMEAKSREIRDELDIIPLDPRFCLRENLADNPLVWLMEINGYIVDIRTQPLEIQELAFKAGRIPFLPEAGPESASQNTVTDDNAAQKDGSAASKKTKLPRD